MKYIKVSLLIKNWLLPFEARRIAAAEHRSVPRQIEYYFRMALIADENPDLSFSLIREILKADAEEAAEEYTFGWWELFNLLHSAEL